MLIDDIILIVLALWAVPLGLFVFYFVTDPVPGTRFRRRVIDLRSLERVSLILIIQKLSLIAVIVFIFAVRFTGGFAGREWVAFGLYGLLVLVASAAFFDMRREQLPRERLMRRSPRR